jgi:hypothetical protein
VPRKISLAGSNGVKLLDCLSRKLATMDDYELEISRRAEQVISGKQSLGKPAPEVIELFPVLQSADTIRRV